MISSVYVLYLLTSEYLYELAACWQVEMWGGDSINIAFFSIGIISRPSL